LLPQKLSHEYASADARRGGRTRNVFALLNAGAGVDWSKTGVQFQKQTALAAYLQKYALVIVYQYFLIFSTMYYS
jgi:hypothetical protein